MKLDFLPILQREGMGNIDYATQSSIGASGAAVANNGLSIFGGTTIQLGGPDGAAAAANLLNNREIPMAGFNLKFSNIGSTAAAGNSVLIFKADATKLQTQPFMIFTDSAGVENGRINFLLKDVYIGVNTGQSCVGLDLRNTFVGNNAGQSNTTQSRNTAFGSTALRDNVAGSNCTAIGYGALQSPQGNNNTAVGFQAGGITASTGTNNTSVGVLAGQLPGTSQQNTCIGSGAMANGVSQNNNVGVGYNVFNLPAAMGDGNVGIGSLVWNNSSTIGANNVFVGFNIGATIHNVAAANVWLGANIDATAVGLTNTTVLGQGITIGVSNVAAIGRADQNIIIGSSAVGTDNGSKLQIIGSISLPIRSTAVNTALAATDHTLILTAGALTITNTLAANRIYWVVNQAAASTFSVNYTNFAGAAVNTIAANAVIAIQSDAAGATWQRIV